MCLEDINLTVIFSLKDSDPDWAAELNRELELEFPDFYKSNPLIGSSEWWERTEFDTSNGRIVHVGHVIDEDGDLVDVVEIQPLDENYDGENRGGGNGQPINQIYREDFWLDERVAEGKLIRTESTTVCPTGELDENSIYIETLVKVW